MLDEVITRRFKNKWEKPSLIIVDGGKPQVRRIMQVLEKLEIIIPILGIAKGPDRFILGVKVCRPSILAQTILATGLSSLSVMSPTALRENITFS